MRAAGETRRKASLLTVSLTAALFVALVFVKPADAVWVYYAGTDTLAVEEPPGISEANNVTISLAAGLYTVNDPGAEVVPAAVGCVTIDFNTVTCSAAGVTRLRVNLGLQNDALTITAPTPSTVTGGVGEDQLNGGPAADDMRGESGVDTMTGGDGNDRLEGGDDNDTLSGGPGEDTLIGGFGDDTVRGEGDGDTLDGEGQFGVLAPGRNLLEGGDGPDYISGGEAADTIVGGAGNDATLNGFGGDDQISGGDGDDGLLGGEGNDSLSGENGIDSLYGEGGNDLNDGGPGDDTMSAGLGPSVSTDSDDLRGGDGRDTVQYVVRTESVLASIDGGANDGFAGEGDNVAFDIEVVHGGAGDDTIIGSPNADTLDGRGGDDIIDGLAGDDALEGGADDGGSDNLTGGLGNDSLSGSAGDDALAGGDGSDSLTGAAGSDSLGGGAADDRLVGGFGSDRVAGDAGNDDLEGGDPVFVAGDTSDRLDGGGGNDTLKGSLGDDQLTGGDGKDAMSGGGGRDTAQYVANRAAVEVTLDNQANDGQQGELDNVNADVEDVDGGGDEDTFTGSGVGNQLDGAAGEDYVDGAAGVDELLGGGSIDVVRARDSSADVVNCGRARDLAVVDRKDKVSKSCELTDDGVGTRATLGSDVVIQPAGGAKAAQTGDEPQFGLPGMGRTVPLKDRIEVPVRSKVDASDAAVELIGAGRGKSRRQTATAEGAPFTVLQERARSPVLELRLPRLTARDCHVRRGKAGSARHRRKRRLGTRTRGRIKNTGNHGSGTSRGTSWVIEDGCEGTLFRVRSGTVVVTDFGLDRRITLHAGERYLAKARR